MNPYDDSDFSLDGLIAPEVDVDVMDAPNTPKGKQKGRDPNKPAAPRPPAPDLQDAALALREKFGADVAYSEIDGAWLKWTGKFWKDISRSKTELCTMAVAALRDVGVSISNEGKVTGTIHLAEALMRREFETRPDLVNFNNGTLEVRRVTGPEGKEGWEIGEFRAHDIADGLRHCLPYDYEPGKGWPTIRAFLEGSVPDPLGRECLMAHAGLALMRDTAMHYALILHGPTRSGKGTMMRLFRIMAGASLNDSEKWAPAEIFDDQMEGKRARRKYCHVPIACVDEVPSAATRAEETFKIMTAHGAAAMRGIGQDYDVEDTWTPKIVMATNDIVNIKDPSGAMQARIAPVSFPNHRPEGQRDLVLVERMEAELPGFAVACILEGLNTKNRGYYNRSRAMMNTLTMWGLLGNPLRQFVNDYCVLGDSYRTPTARLHEKYSASLVKAGQKPLQQSNMTSELTTMGLGLYAKKGRAQYTEFGGKKTVNGWCIFGLALREDVGLSTFAEEASDDLSETDYRPAVSTDEDLIRETLELLNEKDFDRAYKVALKVRDESDRTWVLDTLREAKVLPIAEQGLQLAA